VGEKNFPGQKQFFLNAREPGISGGGKKKTLLMEAGKRLAEKTIKETNQGPVLE